MIGVAFQIGLLIIAVVDGESADNWGNDMSYVAAADHFEGSEIQELSFAEIDSVSGGSDRGTATAGGAVTGGAAASAAMIAARYASYGARIGVVGGVAGVVGGAIVGGVIGYVAYELGK